MLRIILLRLMKWSGITLLLVILGLSLFFGAMRFHDGPRGIIAGGPFTTGEPAPAPGDWQFLQGRATIEFQTLEPATSRTVWLAVHEGRLYIVSAYMNTNYGKVWKQWPHYLQADDRIVLRIDGALYEQRMVRLMDHPALLDIINILSDKYNNPLGAALTIDELRQALAAGDIWLFEVVDREPQS